MKHPAARVARILLPPAIVFVCFVAVWGGAVALFDLKPFMVPSPERVAKAAAGARDRLLEAGLLTGAASLCGLALSVVAGSLIAFCFSQSRMIQGAFYPYAIFLQTVPIVAIAPVIAIWNGQNFGSVVIVVFIVSLFPIITNVTHGLTSVEPQLLELFAINNASRLQVLMKLRIPNAIPDLVTGVRVSAGLSVIGAIVGEFFVGSAQDRQGLGYLIQLWSGQLKTAELFAAIFVSTLLGLLIFWLAGLLGRLALRRRPAAE